jgi:hypothetical protein
MALAAIPSLSFPPAKALSSTTNAPLTVLTPNRAGHSDKGSLRGIQFTEAGNIIQNLSLSEEAPSDKLRLCAYEGLGNYVFRAEKLTNNRVALYIYNRDGNLCDIMVLSDGSFACDKSKLPLVSIANSSGLKISSSATFMRFSVVVLDEQFC